MNSRPQQRCAFIESPARRDSRRREMMPPLHASRHFSILTSHLRRSAARAPKIISRGRGRRCARSARRAASFSPRIAKWPRASCTIEYAAIERRHASSFFSYFRRLRAIGRHSVTSPRKTPVTRRGARGIEMPLIPIGISLDAGRLSALAAFDGR